MPPTTTAPAAKAAVQNPRNEAATRLRQAKLLFLLAAGISFLFSITLWFLVDREQGLFVGMWVPSILALGALMTNGQEGPR